MTIHPLFVHFPIALFTLYALAELLRIERLRREAWWLYLKTALVVLGTCGAAASLLAGEHDEGLLGRGAAIRQIVELHSTLAYTTTGVFGIVALIYLVVAVMRGGTFHETPAARDLLLRLSSLANRYINSWFAPLIALIGLALITITGALGGSLVYGRDADPMITLVYKLFGL